MNDFKYKYYFTDSGFCRVVYKRMLGHQRLIYCLMDDGYGGNVALKFYRCSQDGEPSHEVKFEKSEIQPSPGDDRIDLAVNEFLAKEAA